MRNKLWQLFEILSLARLFGCTLVLGITFIYAYAHDKEVWVTINDYGEANIELIYLVYALVCGLITFFRLSRKFNQH